MPKQLKLRELTQAERETLERISRSRTAAQREVERVQIILERSRGKRVDFLNHVVATWTDKNILFILDNLSIHKTLDVLLWALAHPRIRFLFQPTYAPWLNLIEPWWKTLRSLALKGRYFQVVDEITAAITWATDFWNDHRHPYVWRKVFV